MINLSHIFKPKEYAEEVAKKAYEYLQERGVESMYSVQEKFYTKNAFGFFAFKTQYQAVIHLEVKKPMKVEPLPILPYSKEYWFYTPKYEEECWIEPATDEFHIVLDVPRMKSVNQFQIPWRLYSYGAIPIKDRSDSLSRLATDISKYQRELI
jgi:hypothetical protein